MGDEQFNEVFEQLIPDLEMASKTIFDRAEERAFARGKAKADQKVQEIAQEANQKIRKAIINLIQKTNMTD